VKLRVGEALPKGKVVIGTVEGDVHDIGKNIVKMMFEVAGFTVYDLGKDVPLERFVEEQIRTDSDIVAVSAMMTTTMIGMKKVVQMVKEKNPNVPIMLGGAPLNPEVAEEYGADGYAESAGNAVQEAIKIISQFRKIRKERKFHNDDASLKPTGVDLPKEVKLRSKGVSRKR
jgi:methanogenic corrinoid protein MtbC1